MRRRKILVLFLIGVTNALSVQAGASSDLDCRRSFAAGQEWSLRADSSTTVVIGRAEEWHDQTAVHVSILNARILSVPGGSGTATQIAHVPFLCEALKQSVAELLRTDANPLAGFEAGYNQWREANGGIFTIRVTEVIDLMPKKSSGD